MAAQQARVMSIYSSASVVKGDEPPVAPGHNSRQDVASVRHALLGSDRRTTLTTESLDGAVVPAELVD